MFYLFGRKKRIIKYYPEPLNDFIVEPFAGSASYSLHYHYKNVILYEKDQVIYNIWKYIIETSTPERILELPILEQGDNINDDKFKNYNMNQEEKDLIGYHLGVSGYPRKKPSCNIKTYCRWNEKTRRNLSENILKVKHWKIYNTSYENAENITATWFIDPPYQGNGGKYYKCSNKYINYDDLANYVRSRKGQIICCENEEGKWLNFKFLIEQNQQTKKHIECIFYLNENVLVV